MKLVAIDSDMIEIPREKMEALYDKLRALPSTKLRGLLSEIDLLALKLTNDPSATDLEGLEEVSYYLVILAPDSMIGMTEETKETLAVIWGLRALELFRAYIYKELYEREIQKIEPNPSILERVEQKVKELKRTELEALAKTLISGGEDKLQKQLCTETLAAFIPLEELIHPDERTLERVTPYVLLSLTRQVMEALLATEDHISLETAVRNLSMTEILFLREELERGLTGPLLDKLIYKARRNLSGLVREQRAIVAMTIYRELLGRKEKEEQEKTPTLDTSDLWK